MSESTELAVVNAQNAVEIFTKGGLAGILDGVEKKVRAMSLDASTATGREEIRSVAYKVTRTKTALDAEAKKLTEGWRAATSQVNSERKVAQERLEALAEEVRAPLTAFENKEKNRIAGHEAAIAEMNGLLEMLRAHPNMEAGLLVDHREDLAVLHADRQWEEFDARAKKLRSEIFQYLEGRIDARLKFDHDQEELARLRKEEADRKVREHEAKLKAEAAEAARIEAERKAKEAADAEAKRVIEAAQAEQKRVAAEAERVRVENERQQSEAEAARKREQDAREQAEKRAQEAEAARIAAANKAEADRIAAEERRVAELKAAQEKAKKDTEAAVAKEKARVEAQRKTEAEAQAKREADEKNIARIRKEIGEDLTKWSLHDLVAAIMDGKVRNVRVIF